MQTEGTTKGNCEGDKVEVEQGCRPGKLEGLPALDLIHHNQMQYIDLFALMSVDAWIYSMNAPPPANTSNSEPGESKDLGTFLFITLVIYF